MKDKVLSGVACSAGVFFGRANILLAKAHVETRKEGTQNGASQKEPGRVREERRENAVFVLPSPSPLPLFPSFALAPTLRVIIFTLPNLPPS